MIIVITVVLGLTCYCIGLAVGLSNRKTHTQYLNEKYLKAVDKAQKAIKKNKATAEFWYNESERYKSLLENHQHFLDKSNS